MGQHNVTIGTWNDKHTDITNEVNTMTKSPEAWKVMMATEAIFASSPGTQKSSAHSKSVSVSISDLEERMLLGLLAADLKGT